MGRAPFHRPRPDSVLNSPTGEVSDEPREPRIPRLFNAEASFLPIGSIWLGILALSLELVALSSIVVGWGTVSQVGLLDDMALPRSRIELTTNSELRSGR